MSEHTAGPWHNSSGLIYAECNEDHGDQRDYCQLQIAGVIRGETYTPQDEANANLIAAAPELLMNIERSTRYLVSLAERNQDIEAGLYARENLAVIAKARGQA